MFEEWPKIQRYRKVRALVTEKIDGTNAQIYVPEDPTSPLLAGSRNRWLTAASVSGKQSTDNFNFADFVLANGEVLRRLGPGRHYGEWYGAGIGRRYGLTERRFALFNVDRYAKDGLPAGLPANVGIVPTVYHGEFNPDAIDAAIRGVYAGGSVAVPGYNNPEGVVILIGGGPGAMRLKVTDGNDEPKWKTEALAMAAAQPVVSNADRKACLGGGLPEGVL